MNIEKKLVILSILAAVTSPSFAMPGFDEQGSTTKNTTAKSTPSLLFGAQTKPSAPSTDLTEELKIAKARISEQDGLLAIATENETNLKKALEKLSIQVAAADEAQAAAVKAAVKAAAADEAQAAALTKTAEETKASLFEKVNTIMVDVAIADKIPAILALLDPAK